MSEITLQWERWSSVWPDLDVLARKHFHEVEGDFVDCRSYGLVPEVWEKLDVLGVLKIMAARRNGKLVGYCMWTISPDIECCGIIKAEQGPVYMDERSSGAGFRMFKKSLGDLKLFGVKSVFMHHRLLGRGSKLWIWFKRLKAVEIKHEYHLMIGD